MIADFFLRFVERAERWISWEYVLESIKQEVVRVAEIPTNPAYEYSTLCLCCELSLQNPGDQCFVGEKTTEELRFFAEMFFTIVGYFYGFFDDDPTEEELQSFAQRIFAVIGVGGLSTGAICIVMIFAGFGTTGIIAGTLAAMWQSTIGSVAAGSWFAFFQSAGALGLYVKYLLYSALVSTASISAALMNMSFMAYDSSGRRMFVGHPKDASVSFVCDRCGRPVWACKTPMEWKWFNVAMSIAILWVAGLIFRRLPRRED